MIFEIGILAAAPIVTDGTATGTVGGVIFYIVIALCVSFLCSLLEAVLLSSSYSQVEMLAQAGSSAGLLMRKHKQNIEQAIAAILTLNTIAHTVGAAGAGAEAAGVFGNEWVGVISAIITLLILVLSEIIPKTLGAAYWLNLLPFAGYAIRILIWLTYPAVWSFERLTALITPKHRQPSVTRSELEMLAQMSMGQGGLLEKENRIFRNLLHLDKVRVSDIMTPRMVVFTFQRDLTVREALAEHPVIAYSRIPIYDESIDDCNSFILRHDLLQAAAEDRHEIPLLTLARPLVSVPETLSVAKVMDEFLVRQQHLLLVFDEHGGSAGVVTLEDAIESLFGLEITDESDVVSDLRELARQRHTRKTIEQAQETDAPAEDNTRQVNRSQIAANPG